MQRQAASNKILVLGIDGMDPKLTRKYLAKGIMPNTAKFIERGATAKDLIMLGAQPTITPPMWTTLATGAYPSTHGITDFWLQDGNNLDSIRYGLSSEDCKAEQLWNVFAEAGKKTLVWHWPGSSWPPSSDSPNLSVVDGTQPGSPNGGTGVADKDFILVSSRNTNATMYKPKAAAGNNIPCVIEDLATEELASSESTANTIKVGGDATITLILSPDDGQGTMGRTPFDVILSEMKEPTGWANAPKDAIEITMLMSQGLIRRPCLIVKNDKGIYDTVHIYKNKKSEAPLAILPKGEFVQDVIDEAIKNDVKLTVTRNMRVLELAEDGSKVRIWVSSAMDLNNDVLWHPKSLYKSIVENCGAPKATCMLGGYSEELMKECMVPEWTALGQWQADCLNYLIENEGYEVIFSHYHNVDLEGHMTIKYMKKHEDSDFLEEHVYAEVMEMCYKQTDDYIGRFMHLLDNDWTIFIVSDHAQVCPEVGPIAMGEPMGVNVRLMQELGYTNLKYDENGKELREIDWDKTKAVAVRGNHIYINLKGRNPYGIVDPADKYEVEEQIMTDLYGYKHPKTGKRVIALALRNKDALLLGLSGPECGDIIYWDAEGYNYDHGDILSTVEGYADTSVSPIFMAAGKGIKENFVTNRVIRQVDFAPTMAVIGGVRMPRECEGAVAYQILTEEY